MSGSHALAKPAIVQWLGNISPGFVRSSIKTTSKAIILTCEAMLSYNDPARSSTPLPLRPDTCLWSECHAWGNKPRSSQGAYGRPSPWLMIDSGCVVRACGLGFGLGGRTQDILSPWHSLLSFVITMPLSHLSPLMRSHHTVIELAHLHCTAENVS
jgi:hypothetical protein